MNLKFLCVPAVVGLLALATGCTPESYDLPAPSVTSAELVEGIAYKVAPLADNPNKIQLTSLTKGAQALWKTPQGMSQSSDFVIDLPFSGTYEVTFGVETQGGQVWGEPYTFTVDQNDFGMLSDEIWTNLAGGVDENGQGNPKKWVPCDNNYGIGRCSSPLMYMSPDDYPNPEFDNWSPNWDPGFQSWLIPADDPYLDSYMVFGLDPIKGSTVEIYRNSADGVDQQSGTFSLNISDPKHPNITFNGGTYSIHNKSFDGVCANYTNEIKIISCTPYLLQIATMRTNDEGPWWLVWNFISEDVKKDPSILPTEGPDLIETVPVKEPEYEDLEASLFTISTSTATYQATQTTFLLNDETPYDFMWWNGASGRWEWVGGYGSSWAPAYEGVEDFALTINKNGNATIESAGLENQNAKFTIDGNKVVFDNEVTLFTAGNHSITGKEFTVMKCSADDNEVVFGVPVETDAAGAVCKYLCAQMTIKAIGGGDEGPIVIPVDNSKLVVGLEADKYMRIIFYNPWMGYTDDQWPIDPTLLKLKKTQKLVVKFTIDGIEWTATPKAAFCCNQDEGGWSWEPDCFSNFQAYDLNTSGENVMECPNTMGATYNFYGSGSLQVSVQIAGFVNADDLKELVENTAKVTITSLTIE